MTGSRTTSAAAQGDAWMPWAIIGLAGLFEAVAGALWVALGASAAAAGHGWDAPPFQAGIGPIRALTTSHSVHDPAGRIDGSTPVLVGVLVAELVVIAAIAWTVTVRVRRSLARRRKLASALAVNARIDVEGTLSRDRAAETARLHPTLTGTAANTTAIGAGQMVEIHDVLGYVLPTGPAVLPGFEDVELAFMAPRSGKTTARAIPKLLGAPGPAVGTANKSDLWQATAKIRGERGRVWTFDPQAITHTPQRFWWNPLARVVDDESADRLAAQFIKVIAANGGSDTFWSESAQELLTALLLAASVGQHAGGGGRSLRDVWRWLNRPTDEEPVRILVAAGWEQLAYGLRGAQNGAVDTREGIFQTARTGARCLRSETILRWVTPPPTPDGAVPVGELRLNRFVDSTADTVYLLSKDGAGSAAPLLAGFLDQLFECCQLSAERNGGRLAVPMTAVIDEAANIAPWDRLPAVASYAGSLGFVFLAILQNYAQGKRVWGEAGMEELFSACTLKLIGAGIDDADFARDISTLVGRHEVDRRSTSYSRGGRSDSWSSEMRDMLPPDELRAMPKGTGLVLFTGRRPMMLQLQPWYTATYQDAVRASIAEGKAAVVDGANNTNGQRAGWGAAS